MNVLLENKINNTYFNCRYGIRMKKNRGEIGSNTLNDFRELNIDKRIHNVIAIFIIYDLLGLTEKTRTCFNGYYNPVGNSV